MFSLSCSFTGGSATLCNKYFSLVDSTGEILTNSNIDREKVLEEIDTDIISCLVSYSGGTLQVQFQILDVNDFVPHISGISQPINVYENVPPGQIIAYLMPVDLDAGLNGTVNFSIANGNEESFFNMSVPSSGGNTSDRLIILNKRINYETHKAFNLTLSLSDFGQPPLTATQYLLINILDVDDEVPTFDVGFNFNVSEDHPIGSTYPIGIIDATDSDSPTHSQIFYQLDVDNSRDVIAAEYFAVNTTSGELYLIEKLDFDRTSKHSYEFRVEARNPGRPSGTKADITVSILDANDEVPMLIPTSTTLNGIYENSNSSEFLFVFEDADTASADKELDNDEVQVSLNPQVSYKLKILKFSALTLISITVNQTIDREQSEFLYMSVTVTDKGVPPLSYTSNNTIRILDVNDNAPQFTNRTFEAEISRSSKPPMLITQVTAMDPDSGENGTVTYSITSVSPTAAINWFSINNDTGLVTLIATPNYETVDGVVMLTVTARDDGTSITLSNTTTLTVRLSPAVTFEPISFQQYSSANLLTSSIVYMEFQTSDTNTLLLYQKNSLNEFAVLEIVNSNVVYNGEVHSNVTVGHNIWYSLLLNKTEVTT